MESRKASESPIFLFANILEDNSHFCEFTGTLLLSFGDIFHQVQNQVETH